MRKWVTSTSDTTAPAPRPPQENSPPRPPAPRSNGWYESIQPGGLPKALQKHSRVISMPEARLASKRTVIWKAPSGYARAREILGCQIGTDTTARVARSRIQTSLPSVDTNKQKSPPEN